MTIEWTMTMRRTQTQITLSLVIQVIQAATDSYFVVVSKVIHLPVPWIIGIDEGLGSGVLRWLELCNHLICTKD